MNNITCQVKYIFNICNTAVTDKDPINPVWEKYPYAKPNQTTRPKIETYNLMESHGSPSVINGYCQIFSGPSKYHTDAETLRLRWFERVLEIVADSMNQITSIGFPPGLNDQQLMKVENFTKRYYSLYKIKVLVVDYRGQTLVDLDRQIKPNYFHNEQLIWNSNTETRFPYRVIKHLGTLNGSYKFIDSEDHPMTKSSVKSSISGNNGTTTIMHSDPSKPVMMDQTILTDVALKSVKPLEKLDVIKSDTKLVNGDTKPVNGDIKPVNGDTKSDVDTKSLEVDAKSLEVDAKSLEVDVKSLEVKLLDDGPKLETTDVVVKKKVRILRNKYIDMFKTVTESWPIFNGEQFNQLLIPINNHLVKTINEDLTKQVLPYPYINTFRAFELTSQQSLKVVILGQDPYFSKKNEAHGLAFSVNDGVTIPPSLLNIFKELETDIPGFKRPTSGNLEHWAKQGVLLLNTALTVLHTTKEAHLSLWRPFTNLLIQTINQNTNGIIFILWGGHAKAYKSMIDLGKHRVLEAAHPSPLSVSKGFFGCKHFSQTNSLLQSLGKQPIDWLLDKPSSDNS